MANILSFVRANQMNSLMFYSQKIEKLQLQIQCRSLLPSKKKKKKKKRHQLLPTYFEHQLSDKHQLHARRSTDEESVSTLIRLIGTSREHVEQHTIDHTRNKGVTDR